MKYGFNFTLLPLFSDSSPDPVTNTAFNKLHSAVVASPPVSTFIRAFPTDNCWSNQKIIKMKILSESVNK